ncbi:MAG: transcriptional repressor [Tannerella sp.]|jgi:Fur family ferric uptake transcriptional regulator|nr:transcriptional repressor [Tannerella sp.]
MIIDDKAFQEIRTQLERYIHDKKLRNSEVRYLVLDAVRTFPKHFTVDDLQEKLDKGKEKISLSTLYNTLLVLLDAGILLRHSLGPKAEYELRKKGETHLHLVCNRCGSVREVRILPSVLRPLFDAAKTRLEPDYLTLYMYGLCSRCKREQKKLERKQNTKSNES